MYSNKLYRIENSETGEINNNIIVVGSQNLIDNIIKDIKLVEINENEVDENNQKLYDKYSIVNKSEHFNDFKNIGFIGSYGTCVTEIKEIVFALKQENFEPVIFIDKSQKDFLADKIQNLKASVKDLILTAPKINYEDSSYLSKPVKPHKQVPFFEKNRNKRRK